MGQRKQQLLKKYRRNKRIGILIALVVLLMLAVFCSWWLLPAGVLLLWIAHEAWLADHLFYAPTEDYQYEFPSDAGRIPVTVRASRLHLEGGLPTTGLETATVLLKIRLRSTLMGRFLDPVVQLGDDRQAFERGAAGTRYLNLTGQAARLLQDGLLIRSSHCRLATEAELLFFAAPQWRDKRIMILAPHADDAELAAFGLYSQAQDVSIITLTQGEIEAEHYRKMGLDEAMAARLKGRLRAWDSMTSPQWGGVPQQNCVQLGYYCMQLPAMREQPDIAFASRESGDADIRPARRWNSLQLPADGDGVPSWNNLIADLVVCLDHFQPEIVVMPHPELDPHADHIATGQALAEALERTQGRPQTLFLYANHLHDNDRWPMGDAGTGVALPPAMTSLPALPVFSHVLDADTQMDKAMVLQMQHDLRPPLSTKRRLRRMIQQVLSGRRWPRTGENEFMRKAVRRHELFWVRELERQ